MKCGIIGTGNMGQVLIHAFIQSHLLVEEELHIHNRSQDKAFHIKENYPFIHVEQSIEEVINKTDIIFLCVKPKQMIPILKKMNKKLTSNQLLVSITSALSVPEIESLVDCQVARMIPSITNQALAGVTLITFGTSIDNERKEILLKSARYFSEPVIIEEEIIRISSDMVSCGPAFFSYFAQKYIQAASESTAISTQHATLLIEKMLIGLGTLLQQGHFTLEELIEKVTVAGGITGVGIESLEKNQKQLFYDLIDKTHEKFYQEKKHLTDALQKHE
jgi:competence protein ComER